MRRAAAIAAILAAVIGSALWLRAQWLARFDGDDGGSILVVLVGSRSGVQTVRDAIDPRRIVAETTDAFALAEGRIVAAHAEAVAEPLVRAGWTDRPLEFFGVPHREAPPWTSGRRRQKLSEEDRARMERLAELTAKPSLTQGEAIFVLKAMDDGLL